MNDITGTIFNIQHFSTEDGPGIRTVVFLKGCPLRCRWCANPESQNPKPELMWAKTDCIGCQGCLRNLQNLGCQFTEDGLHWNGDGRFWGGGNSNAKSDGKTLANGLSGRADLDAAYIDRVCPTAALHVVGRTATIEEVINEVEQDHTFYENSGGGLTVSGGEPLSQPKFTLALLKEAKARHIHTAIETSSYCKKEDLLEAANDLDLLYTDVKTMDDKIHIENTGVSNTKILENIRAVREAFPTLKIIIRTPVIPHVNDDETSLTEIAAFVNSLGENTEHEKLKYHTLGLPKYEALRRAYPMAASV